MGGFSEEEALASGAEWGGGGLLGLGKAPLSSAEASVPREAVPLGRNLNKPGTLTHAGPPGFSACGGDSVDPWRVIAVRVRRRGLGSAWTPGRASWRIKCATLG